MDTQPEPTHKQKDIMLPASIIVAALLISGSWIYTTGVKNIAPSDKDATAGLAASAIENVGDITSSDHVRGDRNAPVTIVEFSDLECPFCKVFHTTMKQVVSEFDGKVKWVYRHFPLDSLHPVKARKGAEASECANELGGDEKFWAFVDRYFEVTPSNNQFDMAQLPVIAEYIGLNRKSFESCLASGKYASFVEEQLQDAEKSGGTGTPYSIIISKNGKKFPINGALPYAQIKRLIEEALKN